MVNGKSYKNLIKLEKLKFAYARMHSFCIKYIEIIYYNYKFVIDFIYSINIRFISKLPSRPNFITVCLREVPYRF